MVQELILLCIAAFAAGFIDAIVGGGGLLQTPATLLILPNYPAATIFGTVKIPSLAGTAVAAWKYGKQVKFNYKVLLSCVVFAFFLHFWVHIPLAKSIIITSNPSFYAY